MKYEVEVANQYNDSWLFPANGGQKLRGRWSYNNVAHLDIGERHRAIQKNLMQFDGKIPGMYISVDTDRNVLSIYDPLSETEHGRKIWAAIKNDVQVMGNGTSEMEPVPRIDVKLPRREKDAKDNPGANILKSWLFWIARGVEDGVCQRTQNSSPIPPSSDIDRDWEGVRVREPFDTSTSRQIDIERTVKPVEAIS